MLAPTNTQGGGPGNSGTGDKASKFRGPGPGNSFKPGFKRPGKKAGMEVEGGEILIAAITKTNKGGNTPGGNANGVPSRNPAGKAPPGQNKKTTGNPK